MKKLFIISAIAASGLIYNNADAQLRIHFGIRFRPVRTVYVANPVVVEQPAVCDPPADVSYDSNDDYYYLPDVDAYYNVNDQCYFYYDGADWISAAYLPGEYRDYDWRSARRFEVRANRPYLHADFYRSHYNGRPVEAWAHLYNNRHFDGGYANRGNGYNQHFDNRDHFDNREHSGYNQHNGDNGQRFDNNRGQGGFKQSSQKNEGDGQRFNNRGGNNTNPPVNQKNGHSRENKGADEHFVKNSPLGGFNAHRMTKS